MTVEFAAKWLDLTMENQLCIPMQCEQKLTPPEKFACMWYTERVQLVTCT